MTAQPSQSQPQVAETKQNDRDSNYRLQEAVLKEKYEKEILKERNERLKLEKEMQQIRAQQAELAERSKKRVEEDDEEDDSEPYVDRKRLKKEQAKFGNQLKQETKSDIQKAVQGALQEERKQNWIKQNGDFYDVMQLADKLYQKDPELAETILEMPEGFERQKLVYKNIKALGLHKPEEKQSSIQEKIDSNRKSPYYQPSGVGSAPYASVGDFSAGGQKNAYQKMQDLKNRLRLG